jgi:hypothetical protein
MTFLLLSYPDVIMFDVIKIASDLAPVYLRPGVMARPACTPGGILMFDPAESSLASAGIIAEP